MRKTVRLMSLQLGLLLILFASLQVRSMPPRMYSFLEATAVLIGTTAMYEGMPASAFDWSY
jgi:predicted acyltransferase